MIALLDEPFSAVDQETRSSPDDLIRVMSPQVPGPTIYVTHNAEDARNLAEYAVRLTAGRLAVDERPWESAVE